VKIRRVAVNNRKAQLEITTFSRAVHPFPYVKLDPRPTSENRIHEVFVDKELAAEAVTYVLESGDEGSVHIDQVLAYNDDPTYRSELLVYELTLEVRRQVERRGLSRREIARRLGTSVPQLYRLLDPANTRKSINQIVALLHVLDCRVDFVVRERCAGT
jgi:predicted XRE-type DNA-binding protein